MAAKERKYIFEDFSRDPVTGDPKDNRLFKLVTGPWRGKAMALTPFEGHVLIDFTGPLGSTTSVYYALAFQLPKWESFVAKFDEWIEVSPVHQQYYQLTHKQKEDLEAKIRTGLGGVAQAVADYELLLHDKRKYLEVLHYLGYPEKDSEIDFSVSDEEKNKRIDNHSLKAMFIDQVDVHTGEAISMRSIVSRWPTMISDFMRLDDRDLDVDSIRKRLGMDISKAEAVVLATKNKLYQEWKKIFLPDVVARYKRINELVRARQRSVDEYKEWIKPYIARHRMIEEGLSKPTERAKAKTSFITGMGHAISSAQIVLWTWKDFTPPEIYKIPAEITAKEPVDVYDDWTKKNLIFNEDIGLIVEYPWITDEWVKKQRDELFKSGWLKKDKLYYSFIIVTFTRTNMRAATGEDLENGMFDINLVAVSQNVMFVKLLELKAKQEEFNMYVDEMLGVPYKIEGKKFEGKKKTGIPEPVKNILDKFSLNLQFTKSGPYESDFDERITKYYLVYIAGDRYKPIVSFIKQKIGYGVK